MAWGTPVLGAVTKSNSDSTPTLSLPSHSTGDLLIAVCATRMSDGVTITSIDQSYIELVTKAFPSTGGELTVYGKVAGASEVAPTVTLSGTPGDFIAFMLKASGGPSSATVASDLIDNSQTATYADTNATSYIPTITPSVDNDLILWCSARAQINWNASGAAVSPGATLLTTNDTDANYAGTNGISMQIAYEIQTTATTRAEWNNVFTDGSSPTETGYCAVGLALKAGATTVEYLRLLTHPSAASAGSVEGWVIGDDNTTYYGYFSGKSFEASLDGTQAELLVPTADISPDGATLTTSDTPQVVVRNAIFGATMCDATVVEE